MKNNMLATLAALSLSVFATIASANPAVIMTDFGCAGIGGSTNESLSVATTSTNNNAMMSCKLQVSPPIEGTKVEHNFESTGLLCGMFTSFGGVATEDWKQVVSASGQSTIVCKYKLQPGA